MTARTEAAVATDTEILLAKPCSLIEFLILFLREKISQQIPPVCQLGKCFFMEWRAMFCVSQFRMLERARFNAIQCFVNKLRKMIYFLSLVTFWGLCVWGFVRWFKDHLIWIITVRIHFSLYLSAVVCLSIIIFVFPLTKEPHPTSCSWNENMLSFCFPLRCLNPRPTLLHNSHIYV